MKLPFNPFDFANPVNGKDLFAGRHAELEEVRYYLDEMGAAPRPINLALLGPRAAGKTSFLNIIELDANARGYCPVRIDLNEGDAQNDSVFFFKLFDAVLCAACKGGAYGGLAGKTYDTYLDMVYAYRIPEARTFCPFLFPLQYAKSRQAAVEAAFVSDHSLKHDLAAIHEELKVPTVLLFDECNVLAVNRVLLQKIRNLFMNTPGFMLVLTGTPELFPVIDDVFSPIIRQFKKIQIGAFKDIKETINCIRRPLETLKSVDPEELIDLSEDSNTVREIHELSGGRPYEVKLICHMLFRRIQQNKAPRMVMDFSVLEDVRRELETSQDISKRPIVTQVQRLKETSITALALLCGVDGRLSFEDVWAAYYVFRGTGKSGNWTEQALKAELDELVRSGLIVVHGGDGGKLKFCGDDFDKIYTKYLAKERGVKVPFWPGSIVEFVDAHLRGKVNPSLGKLVYEMPVPEGLDILSAAKFLAHYDGVVDPLADGREIFKFVYKRLFSFRGQDTLPMTKVDISLGGTRLQYWFYPRTPISVDLVPNTIAFFEQVAARSVQMSCKVTSGQVALPVPSSSDLVAQVTRTTNESVRRSLGEWHIEQMAASYLANDIADATLHAELALQYCGNDSLQCRVNIGYLKLIQGDLNAAEQLLDGDVETGPKGLSSLRSYNLAMLRIKQGRWGDAYGLLEALVPKIDEQDCVCLLIPTEEDGSLGVKEQRGDLKFVEIVRNALDVVKAFASSRP